MFLQVSVGPHRCALPSASVIETFRPLQVRPVADAPPAVLGLAVVRGEPAPVVDLAALIGAPPAPCRRWISLRVADRVVVLAVTEVHGLIRLPETGRTDLPPLLQSARTELIAQMASRDGALIALLEPARLVDHDFERLLAAERA